MFFLGHRGYTGRLIHAALPPTLAVALPELSRARPLAGQLEVFSDQVEPGDLVLNCLGPFSETQAAVTDLCLRRGAHYLDICAEWQVFEALQKLDEQARDALLALTPAGYIGNAVEQANAIDP